MTFKITLDIGDHNGMRTPSQVMDAITRAFDVYLLDDAFETGESGSIYGENGIDIGSWRVTDDFAARGSVQEDAP